MQDLISQYMQGRQLLRERSRLLEKKIIESDDSADLMDLKNDRSLIEGMIRDMTEAIGLMTSPFHKVRGENRTVLMDPHLMSSLDITEERWDPEEEDNIRSAVLIECDQLMRSRMDLLTSKQRRTLLRWIYEQKTLSQIAAEEGVSRQAIFDRIFGNKSHSGALRKLRDGR